MNKITIATCITAFCAAVLHSCVYEPYYIDNYLVSNKFSEPVKIFKGYTTDSSFVHTDSLFIEKNNEMEFYEDRRSRHWSPFDSDEEFIFPFSNLYFHLCFNDSVSVFYKDFDSSFAKSMSRTACWAILSEHHTMGRSTHKVLYTIDEQDYQNALIQCGYGKKQKILLP